MNESVLLGFRLESIEYQRREPVFTVRSSKEKRDEDTSCPVGGMVLATAVAPALAEKP